MVLKFWATILFILSVISGGAQSVNVQDVKDEALAGNAESQFRLACIYFFGCFDREVDESESFRWAKKSADSGNAKAQCFLANLYYRRGDFQNHAYYLKKSADSGYTFAEGLLGMRLLSGSGMKIDKERGLYWLQMSAESGNRVFQKDLSYIYYMGEKVDQDRYKGAYWLHKSAEQGHISSMYTLYLYYRTGNGVPIDVAKGAYWLKRVAESKSYVNCFDEEFIFTPPIFDDITISECQCVLGECFIKGVGVGQNMEQAAFWIKKAKNGSGTTKEDAIKLWNQYRLWEYLK